MKFWDASAIVPLLVPEPASHTCYALAKKDPHMMVWFLTPTEILSALLKQGRTGGLPRAEIQAAKKQLEKLTQTWTEIIHFEGVRSRAHRLLESHPLRAADSLQLAAALIAFQERPQGAEFVCLDKQLALAAEQEGFTLLP